MPCKINLLFIYYIVKSAMSMYKIPKNRLFRDFLKNRDGSRTVSVRYAYADTPVLVCFNKN